MVFRYAVTLALLCLKRPWPWIATIALACAACTGIFVDIYDEDQTHDLFAQSTYAWQVSIQIPEAGGDIPEDYLHYRELKVSAAERAFTATKPAELYRAVADYCNAQALMGEAGYLTTDPSLIATEQFLTSRLVTIGYSEWPPATPRTSPALYYAAAMYHHLPYWMLYAPAITLSTCMLPMLKRNTAISRAPVGSFSAAAAQAVVVAATSLALTTLAWFPAFVYTSLVNGIGCLNFPVAFMQNGNAIITSVGRVLLHAALLLVLASSTIYLVGRAVFGMTSNTYLAVCTAVALVMAPALCDYAGFAMPVAAEPSAYLWALDISHVVGWATLRPQTVTCSLSFGPACALFAVTSTLLVLFTGIWGKKLRM